MYSLTHVISSQVIMICFNIFFFRSDMDDDDDDDNQEEEEEQPIIQAPQGNTIDLFCTNRFVA